jgi:hypothetical protein
MRCAGGNKAMLSAGLEPALTQEKSARHQNGKNVTQKGLQRSSRNKNPCPQEAAIGP